MGRRASTARTYCFSEGNSQRFQARCIPGQAANPLGALVSSFALDSLLKETFTQQANEIRPFSHLTIQNGRQFAFAGHEMEIALFRVQKQ